MVQRSSVDDLMMFVIDVLRYDMETVDFVVQLLNNEGCIGWRFAWARDFTESDVMEALKRLVDIGMVQCYVEPPAGRQFQVVKSPVDLSRGHEHFWFELTAAGWAAWERWSPPIDPSEPPS
jgi:hypothetical protein